MQVLSLLVIFWVGVEGLPFSSLFLRPQSFYHVQPVVKYYQPIRFSDPLPELHVFGNTFHGPPIPIRPHNETEEAKPEKEEEKLVTTTPKPEQVSPQESQDSKDYKLEELLKKFESTPFSVTAPREQPFGSTVEVYPRISSKPIYTDIGQGFDNVDTAYGLPGFRPFYFRDALLKSNANDTSDGERTVAVKTSDSAAPPTSHEWQHIFGFLSGANRPDPDIIVFNTKEVPFRKASEVPTDDIDIRFGEPGASAEKKSSRQYLAAYKDIMFLNKSFLSTVAPYLH